MSAIGKSRSMKAPSEDRYNAESASVPEEDKEENKNMSSISKALQKERTKQYVIWSWGKNKYGELSHGGTANALIPRGVRGIKGKRIRWISSGAQHSAVITEEGDLFVCGSYLHGKLGIENLTKVNITSFQPVPSLQGMKVKQVECGDYHTLCLLDSGVVYTWGGTLHKVSLRREKTCAIRNLASEAAARTTEVRHRSSGCRGSRSCGLPAATTTRWPSPLTASSTRGAAAGTSLTGDNAGTGTTMTRTVRK